MNTDDQEQDVGRPGLRWVAPVIAVVPVLELYASPVSKISWGGIALALLSLVACFQLLSRRQSEIVALRVSPIVFVGVLTAVTSLGGIVQHDVVLDASSSLRRLALMLLWAIAVSIAGAALCAPAQVFRWVVWIALAATGYLLAQWVAWHALGTFLPSVVDSSFLRPLSQGYADIATLEDYYRVFYFRPTSFFAEPQYYCDYASLALILTLFGPQQRFRPAISVFLSVGLVVSTSTTGLIVGAVIWVCFCLRPTGRARTYVSRGSLALLLLPLLTVAYAGGLLRHFLKIDFSKLGTFRTSGRVGGSFDLFGQLHGTQTLLGVGVGNEGWILSDRVLYYNSVTAVGLGAGVVGLLAALGLVVHLFVQAKGAPRLLIALYALLSIGGSMLYSERSVLWLWLALYGATLFRSADSMTTEDRNSGVRKQEVPHHGWNGVVRNDRDQRATSHRLRRDSDLLSG